MRVYSYSEARQQFAELLNRASREGQVEIRRRDGNVFVVRPATRSGSPLDVPGIDAGLSRAEIVDLVRESRRSTARLLNKTRTPQRPLHRERRPRQGHGSVSRRRRSR
jgi:prevent-host-death family protein